MSYVALGLHGESISVSRRAMERIEREIAARPDNANAWVSGVIALARLGENERATQWALRAQAIEPDDPMDRYNLGCALAQMSEPSQALGLLESCVPKMSPEFINWMKKDTDLIPLHDHPRYKDLDARGEARLTASQTKQGQIRLIAGRTICLVSSAWHICNGPTRPPWVRFWFLNGSVSAGRLCRRLTTGAGQRRT